MEKLDVPYCTRLGCKHGENAKLQAQVKHLEEMVTNLQGAVIQLQQHVFRLNNAVFVERDPMD